MQNEEWAKEISDELASGQYPKWPNEIMLKLIFGGDNYLSKSLKPTKDWKVLDVGCLFANNLLPFSEIGCDCYGIDIHAKMVKTAQIVADKRGINAEFKVWHNRSLPYPDNYFDLLLSIGTIHYESSEDLMMEALSEFNRVLKPGGATCIMTTGQDHELYKRAEVLGKHRYKIANFDFRDGNTFFFFDTEKYFEYFLKKCFNHVETGRVPEQMMNFTIDQYISIAIK
jgi:ubiquinone/menaquinone biosynthesis C-methylase UbiE